MDFVLETEGLTKVYGGFCAVKDLNLRVRRGTIHTLIGPNGTGKTTCFNLLTKFVEPTAGQITFKGADVTGCRPDQIARLGMVRSFQISAVFPRLSVRDNVRIALQSLGPLSFRFWQHKRVLANMDERAEELLAAVDLLSVAGLPAVQLSYGRKRALEIATTIALRPELLLLDEPTAGLGHEDIERISGLIRRAAENRTVLMIEHNLSVVAELSDTVTVLTRGEILLEGSYAEISQSPVVREAYLGVGRG